MGYHTDVYGLGVVFYRLLTNGKLPYPVVEAPDPDDPDEIVKQLDYGVAPRPPNELNSAVSTEVSKVALRAIATSVDERYATPAEFRAALEQLSKEMA